MHTLQFFSFLISACLLLSIIPIFEAHKSFTIHLIHHDHSPSSPFYNSSMTHLQRIRNSALRSISRFNKFDKNMLNEKLDQSSPSSPPGSIIVSDDGDYLMRIYIGTPPIERLAIADTGSNLVWIQCSPCEGSNCFPQETPLFDPNKSSTFMPLTCDSQFCSLLPPSQRSCGNSNKCDYSISYGDKSTTNGQLAIDSINFGGSHNDGVSNFPKSVFGCGYENGGFFSKKTTGIVGLGPRKLSLVSQLSDQIGHKFSYCLVPFSSTTNSKLNFGDQAIISGNENTVSTPFIINPSLPSYYYLNLEGISVGQNTVQTGQTGGNIIIDSGTTLTILESSFYNNFVDLVKQSLGVDEGVQNPPKPFNFCFNNDNNNNINFPDIVFHFTGASVHMKPGNMFEGDKDIICLMVVPNTHPDGISIFGNLAQINFQVEYDLEGKTVSFAPADCTKN